MIGAPRVRLDSNWVVTGFDNALEAKRRVDALLDSGRIPGLERLGVTFGHAASVNVIFDSLLCWTGQGVPSKAVDRITAAPGRGLPRPPRLLHPRHHRVRARLR